MADRSLVTRLRTDGGPSHELLVLLDQHRVLTTGQLARASGAPERTVRYRLDRLLTAKLVQFARPGREAGSAPRHWWLTPGGARLVAGVAPAEGKRPSAVFAAHAAAIAEVWLAVREHGPAAGVELTGWRADRAGWQQWASGPGGRGEQQTVTPDAVLTAAVPAGPTVAFVEVDLATMAQTQLRAKVRRYLDYAADRMWAGTWPHCPPLLLLTTTQARASTFIAAAATVAARHRRELGMNYELVRRGHGGRDVAHAERLVIAACGLVRDPAAAVTDPVWQLAAGDDDQAVTGPVRLAELLGERARAQAVATGWYARWDGELRQARRLATLSEISRDQRLVDALGDPRAADVLRRLVAADDADTFDVEHPELAEQLLTWWPRRAAGGADVDAARQQILRTLRGHHKRIWTQHARAVLAAAGDPGRADPKLYALVAKLATGGLLEAWEVDRLDEPGRDRAQVQATALGEHPARRQEAVDEQWQHLGWMARRRTSPDELAAAYDEQHLVVCDLCAIARPRPGEDQTWDGIVPDRCPACSTGRLVPYAHRGQVPPLTERLDAIRTRLAGGR